MEVAAPPATSVPASGYPSAAAARSSEAAAPPSAAAAHRRRNDAAAKNRVGTRCTRRRVDEEHTAADTVAGAAGEVTPTAAMGSGGRGAREIREVGMEIEVF